MRKSILKKITCACVMITFLLPIPYQSEVRARAMEDVQALIVTGSVTAAEDNTPLPGVNIVVKGTTIGTTTDSDGRYSLNVPATESILVFSSIGYMSKEITVGTNSTINMALEADITTLGEVVVVGYGTQEKRTLTTTVTNLSSKELLQVGGNGALMSMQGKVAGLSIVNTATADPNSSPSFQIRGASSRNAGLGPLFVINGVPGGNIDNLNQNDIESISVLKGGAASAIYGTRGSNGVIMITTKKGSNTPTAFYEGYTTFDFINNELDVLSPEEYRKFNRGHDFGANTDWLKEISREPANAHKHTIQLSGGSDRTSYILSMDFRDAKGVDLRSTKKEYGARLNLSHKTANDIFEANITIAPRYLESNNATYGAFSQALTLNPTMPVMDPANSNLYNNTNFGMSGSYNPVEEVNTVLSGTEGKYLDMNAAFKVNLRKNLFTQITIAQQTQDFFDFGFTPSTNTGRVTNDAGRNVANRGYRRNDSRILEWIGNYQFGIGEHNVELLGGYSFNYFVGEGVSASNEDFPSDALTYNNLGSGIWILESPRDRVGSYKGDSKLVAFFGRLTYDYKDRYYVSGSLRREGSSKFGYENKWGNFPAASVGWRISKESFFPSTNVIDELKLRADYGVTGNQDFDSYRSLDIYGGFGFYNYNGSQYQVWGPAQNTNYQLRWEKAENMNVGLDFELLGERISGYVNYYSRKNNDLLGFYDVSIPPNVHGSTYVNVGTMRNSGVEIQVSAKAISKGDFSYNVSFAGATNSNEFVSFSNELFKGLPYSDVAGLSGTGVSGVNIQRLEEGRRIGSFFMLKSAGVDATGRLLVYNNEGEIIPGNEGRNDDRQYVGNGLPQFTASLGNTFTYKNFDLNIFLRGAFGYDVFNTTAFFIGTPATTSGVNVLQSAYDGGKYSVLGNPQTLSVVSDYFLEKGDFVKIDNITLGYNFKTPVKFFTSSRVYVTGRNLYTFTKYTGGDPESVSVNGLTPGVNTGLSYYPSTMQLIAGIQLKF